MMGTFQPLAPQNEVFEPEISALKWQNSALPVRILNMQKDGPPLDPGLEFACNKIPDDSLRNTAGSRTQDSDIHQRIQSCSIGQTADTQDMLAEQVTADRRDGEVDRCIDR
jgi:hypothetical protein